MTRKSRLSTTILFQYYLLPPAGYTIQPWTRIDSEVTWESMSQVVRSFLAWDWHCSLSCPGTGAPIFLDFIRNLHTVPCNKNSFDSYCVFLSDIIRIDLTLNYSIKAGHRGSYRHTTWFPILAYRAIVAGLQRGQKAFIPRKLTKLITLNIGDEAAHRRAWKRKCRLVAWNIQ